MTHSSHQILPYQQIYFDNLKWNELYLMKLGHYSKKLFVKGMITCLSINIQIYPEKNQTKLQNMKYSEKVFNNCWEY